MESNADDLAPQLNQTKFVKRKNKREWIQRKKKRLVEEEQEILAGRIADKASKSHCNFSLKYRV